ncbi:GMP synthase-Glutamine amidotransferase [Cribrihabitans marinus]|uniref:GMP synthase-Glutamine amidotransferase n=1 Tax=Cribrihabitans marinus TaxID=1227549 RepID=A0A1H6S6J3_9RHOB|nr:type 1 glutamine amidotransferase [Cribrihabitans marinus]GGH23864.1 GMP synthase [Cribrihabitans marinus]SEI63673.1 GMP synthase-Glutamine amidotransferase [Cribrihabitans marinus]
MHLAILITNTDESAFAQAHPEDGEKFADLIHLARPDWTVEAFSVKDGAFPDDMGRFDGAMITGSPASVRSGEPWVAQLLELIRAMDRRRQPMFAACFGHQAVALALGGQVGENPGGWVHGLTRNTALARMDWMDGLPDPWRLYASHKEQVTALPPGAVNLARSEGCETSGFAIGRHIYTTQHHPEMEPGFIAALTDEMASELGAEVHARAMVSLSEPADQGAFAESVARFFEQAFSPARPADP